MPVIHHIGYAVEDLREGAERFARDFRAGPFFAMEHIVFDEVTYEGAPAVYDHSSAFGVWGGILVELTQVHDAQPAGLAAALTAPGAGLGHVAWLAEDLDDEVARLEATGMRVFHTGRTGPVSAAWLHGPPFGHPVEVLQQGPEVLGFYAMLRAAAHDWDGRDPLRAAPHPPS
jgi:hypothetical protein